MKAFRDDIPGFIACIVAAATLWLGMVHADTATRMLGWLP
jgi:hypothetical protein